MSASDQDVQHDLETDRMLDHDEDMNEDPREYLQRKSSVNRTLIFVTVALSLALLLQSVLFTLSHLGAVKSDGDASMASSCRQPAIRREWRALNKAERKDYIAAVLCLFEKPSTLFDRGSLYDDFAWVHQVGGRAAHQNPSFLPWHRWFIHGYERTLQKECGYKGSLPYWDWEVDWHDLANSSVWDNDHGFGSQTNDQTKTETQFPGEQCVSGPFEGVVLLNFNFSIHPHCLSRHFQYSEHGEAAMVLGNLISPEAMGQLVRSPDYGFLRYMIEMQMHNFVHSGVILGDLNTASSANDPIFWLHHAQLDRLWWNWQQEDPERRLMDYGDSPEQPSSSKISDKLDYLGLLGTQVTSRVMSTDSELLCYMYEN